MTATLDEATADPQQAIAELQRLLTECRAERDEYRAKLDEALEQQTATAEVLGVINSSPGNLTPVFDAMLEKATELCDAPVGTLWLFDGEHINPVATRGAAEGLADFLHRGPRKPNPVQQRQLRGEGTIHLTDLKATALYRDGDTLARAVVDLGGIQTVLSVPLRREDRVLGLFGVYRQETRPFSDKQIALIDNFAAQAVIAMENARLITETREALEQQTATAEVLGVINASPGQLAPVFEAMVERAARLCEADEAALRSFDGALLHLITVHGSAPEVIERLRQLGPTPAMGLYEPFGRGAGVVHIADVRETEIFRDDAVVRQRLDLRGIRSWLAVALRKEGTLLGVINVHRHQVRPFTDKQIALLENFAAQAVIAMENARLITETREALEQQTATAEVLGVINASPGQLAPVFEAMLDKAMTLCGAAFGALMSYEDEKVSAVATRGLAPELADVFRKPIAPRRDGDGPYARFLRGERLQHIVDMAADDALPSLASRPRALAEIGGARTGLEIPLRKEGVLLGSIWLYRREVQPFTDKQIALLENFAAQAVIAMENARLLGELRERTDEIAGWNRELEARVATQLAELERTGKLRRFLAPQLADLIVAQGDESILESHRREIVVVFCDVRGFTAFAERAEPEEVMAFLRDYHAVLGPIVAAFEGTLDHYGGDGVMVFFNDPLPCPDSAKRATEMAVAMREAAQKLLQNWRRHGHDIGFGVGISQGYATLGQIGFAERMDYTAIGTVTNLAARLCGEAKDGQILLSRRVAMAVEDTATLEEIGDLSLKGLSQAVAVYNVVAVGADVSAS